MISAGPLAVLDGVLAGVVLLVAVHNGWVWRRDRSEKAPFWLAVLSLTMVVVLVSGAAVLTRPDGPALQVALSVRGIALGASTVVAMIGLKHLVPGLRVNGWAWFAALAVTVRAVLWFTTDLVVADIAGPGGWPRYGPLAWIALPPALALLAVAVQAVRRSTGSVRALLLVAVIATPALAVPTAMLRSGLGFEYLMSMGVAPAGIAILLLGAIQVARTADARDLLVNRQAEIARIGRNAIAGHPTDAVRRDAERTIGGRASVLVLGADAPTRSGDVVVRGRRCTVVAGEVEPRDEATTEFVASLLQTVAASADRAAADADLAHNATHDALTGLPNRLLLVDRLSARLTGPDAAPVAVVACGLSDLEARVSLDGHAAADAVISRVADAATRAVAGTDASVGRLADDVVVIIEPLADGDPAVVLGRRLAALDASLPHAAGLPVRGSLVLGAVLATPGDDAEDVLRDATAALHRSARDGGAPAVFDPALGARMRNRAETESALARAVERDEIVLHYQPVVDAPTGELVSYEALARWRRDGELVPPDQWIPVAEESGLIAEIGLHVLAIAGRDQALLGVPVAVNVSPHQLADPEFARLAMAAIDGCPTERLTLEVTESSLMADLDRARTTLQRLRDLGLRVALDDFGTSYSSLGVLVSLPIDVLKIDRVFVAGLDTSDGRAVVAAIIGLAHTLGKTTIAEGVETEAQRAALVELGADRLQGYLTGRPAPLDAHLTTSGADPLR